MQVPSKRIKGLPLWPDNNVLLYDKEKKRYLELVKNKVFDAIFIMELNFEGYQFTNHEFKFCAMENYRLVKTFPIARYNNERRISVFIK